jgi:protein-S-isoprenylcysteine O-methyltransferase Ste14
MAHLEPRNVDDSQSFPEAPSPVPAGSTSGDAREEHSPVLRVVAFILAYVILFAVLLFVPAQTLSWPAAQVLLATLLVARAVSTLAVYRVNPLLLAERTGVPIRRGQPMLDRVLVSSFMASFAALVAFCSVDVWHLRLLPPPPFAVRLAGLVLFVLGWWGVGLVLKQNAFAVTTVRHQAERGHHVVDTGIYRVVRHPLYASMIPVMAGMGLWLGTTAGALLTVVPVSILAVRIVLEERFLRRTLLGYDDYATRVRWKMVPGVW